MREKGKKKRNGLPAIEPAKLVPYGVVLLLGIPAAVIIQRTLGLQELVGGFLLASILLGILYRDILRYKPHYVKKQGMLMLLGFMVPATLGTGWAAEYLLTGLARGLELEAAGSVLFGLPMPAGAMLVALLFDFHAAIVFTFVVSLLSGVWQADAAFAVYVFVGSLAAAFSMIACRRRTAVLSGGAYVLAANVLTLLTLLLFEGRLASGEALTAAGFALLGTLAVVAIVSLLLPILEYLFKVTTDISLLELTDLDHPLMKSLMIQAPGTYHHSLIVGSLVEACAEVVGVNPLLARVGAYYHDIGKVKMPEYFIENQASGVSKHEKLSPHMSSMILTSHVKEGQDLAQQYKLPEVVQEIIQQHHGTALITYFYEKARGVAQDAEPPADEYKYPGPRPQSRTAALIMMADAVEAASRVLTEPSPVRIEALVDKIINHIFLEGQLDECELTLKDIYEIKKRFTHILTGILHKRVSYPGFDFESGGRPNESNGKQPAKEDQAKRQPVRA